MHSVRFEKTLHWVLGTAWIIGFLAAPLFSERIRQRAAESWTVALNWFGAILIVLPVATVTYQWLQASSDMFDDSYPTGENLQRLESKSNSYPDVYVIVLDGYARQDILEDYYGFSNRDFTEQIEALGFHVVSGARSNYAWTHLSLPSFLNFAYVTELLDFIAIDSQDRGPLRQLFRMNRLVDLLSRKGLKHIHLQSTYSLTMSNPLADREFVCSSGFGADFYRLVVDSSFLRIWSSSVGAILAECHLEQFARLGFIASMDEPKFVFAHFIPPHHPYLFDRDGNVRRQLSISDQFDFQAILWSRRDEYLDQLIFINNKLLETIVVIQNTAHREALIVLISDHGPQLVDPDGTRQPDFQHARFANLVAVRTPYGEWQLPDDVTLVNVFRYILNRYFDQDFEILENRFFDSRFNYPYDLEEIHFDRE